MISSLFPEQISPHIRVLGNYYFNLYLVQGNEFSALVEVGVSAIVDSVISQLENMNVVPDYLVITHPHADHLTGLEGLRHRFPDAKIIVSEETGAFVQHPKFQEIIIQEDQFIHNSMRDRHIQPGRKPVSAVPEFEDIIAVSETTKISLGGVDLICQPIWGHSPGNIMVHLPGDNAVIVSDSLGFHYPGRFILPLFFTGVEEYLDTIDKITAIEPDIIGPGHQGVIRSSDAKEVLVTARQNTIQMWQAIFLDKRCDAEIAEELFYHYYQDELAIYGESNIRNCMNLLVKRAKASDAYERYFV